MSIAKGIIDTIRIALWRLDIKPSIQRFSNKTRPAEKMTLNQQETLKWKGESGHRLTNSYFRKFENGITSRIRKIQRKHYQGDVYNLHVADDNSYLAEFVAVHNCWIAREAVRQYWNTGFIEESGRFM